jgi:hypothetical protein
MLESQPKHVARKAKPAKQKRKPSRVLLDCRMKRVFVSMSISLSLKKLQIVINNDPTT